MIDPSLSMPRRSNRSAATRGGRRERRLPDLHDLLIRTTPTDLAPVHLGTIARAARRRSRRTRLLAASGGAAAVAALAGVLAVAHPGADRVDPSAATTTRMATTSAGSTAGDP